MNFMLTWCELFIAGHADAEARDDLIGRLVQHNASLNWNSTFYFCTSISFKGCACLIS